VEHVEIGGVFEGGGDVQRLGDLRFDRVVLVPATRARAAEVGGGDRVARGEQRDVMAGGDEPVGEERGEELPRAVVAGRRAPGDGREDADPQG
jgi:hypothetical protein